MDHKLTCLISQQEIAAAVSRLAHELDRDYDGEAPVLIGILKGSFIFLADLVRQMQVPLGDIEFMRFSSYGSATTSAGEAKMQMDLSPEKIQNRPVVIVEDIVDTGITTTAVLTHLKTYQPTSLKLCALLDKPDRRRKPVQIDYLGFTIPDRFIVGYGIDFNQQYRQLPEIYAVEE